MTAARGRAGTTCQSGKFWEPQRISDFIWWGRTITSFYCVLLPHANPCWCSYMLAYRVFGHPYNLWYGHHSHHHPLLNTRRSQACPRWFLNKISRGSGKKGVPPGICQFTKSSGLMATPKADEEMQEALRALNTLISGRQRKDGKTWSTAYDYMQVYLRVRLLRAP